MEFSSAAVLHPPRPLPLDDAAAKAAFFATSALPMLVCARADGTIVAANRAAAKLYGSPPEVLAGLPYPARAWRGRHGGSLGAVAETHRRPDGKSLRVIVHRVAGGFGPHRDQVLLGLTDVTPFMTTGPRGALRGGEETDPETGLRNLPGFVTAGDLYIAVAKRVRQPAALVLIEVANLREVREALGPEACSRELRELGLLLLQTYRESDLLGRVRPGTFAVLMMAPDLGSAQISVQRLQRTVRAWNLAHHDGALRLAFGAAMTAHGEGDPRAAGKLGRRALRDLRRVGRAAAYHPPEHG